MSCLISDSTKAIRVPALDFYKMIVDLINYNFIVVNCLTESESDKSNRFSIIFYQKIWTKLILSLYAMYWGIDND